MWRCALALLIWFGGSAFAVQQRPRKYVFSSYSALPVVGRYSAATSGTSVPAVFLGPSQGTEIVELDNERKVARRVVPVPILRPDVESALLQIFAQSRSQANSLAAGNSLLGVITERDGGLFDNLRYFFSQGQELGDRDKLDEILGKRTLSPSPVASSAVASIVMKKLDRAAAEILGKRSGASSPYSAFAIALEQVLGLRILGLMLEVADRPSDSQLYLGGALLLGLESCDLEFSADNALDVIRQTQKQSRGEFEDGEEGAPLVLLNAHSDEALGLSAACGLPLICSQAITGVLCMDALIFRKSDGSLDITAPHFPSRIAKMEFERSQTSPPSSAPTVSTPSPLAPGIDATTFLQMSQGERRAWLRTQLGGRSNTAVPRPREGLRMLNAACFAIMDVEVVYEVLRRLAECDGDESVASQLADFESKKPSIAREIRVEQAAGDAEKVRALTSKLESMSRLNYNPFLPLFQQGRVSFDVEAWYYENSQSLTGQRKIG